MKILKKKVLMAMSGGVDSSVAAALLKEQGYDVIGVTLKLWENEEELKATRTCCSIEDVMDARIVASKIDIPFYVFNFKDKFKKSVIDYFVKSYVNGLTPNPCIACNRFIKFDALIRRADEMGIDYIATGHYAKREVIGGEYALLKGDDPTKDQGYVLYNMTQKTLARTLFPLGKYKKEEVRKMAEERGLIVARKPDSQEICFIPDNNYGAFIEKYAPDKVKPGNILDVKGNILGKHSGMHNFTIGQRRGLKQGFGKRMYVVGKNPNTGDVIIGEEKDLYREEIIAEDINFITPSLVKFPMEVKAKSRYSQREADATIFEGENNTIIVRFKEPQRAPTPGQAVVFYLDNIILGGGTIKG